jgi:hypothetical protein
MRMRLSSRLLSLFVNLPKDHPEIPASARLIQISNDRLPQKSDCSHWNVSGFRIFLPTPIAVERKTPRSASAGAGRASRKRIEGDVQVLLDLLLN